MFKRKHMLVHGGFLWKLVMPYFFEGRSYEPQKSLVQHADPDRSRSLSRAPKITGFIQNASVRWTRPLNPSTCITLRIHVWYICLHLVDSYGSYGKCIGKYTIHACNGLWMHWIMAGQPTPPPPKLGFKFGIIKGHQPTFNMLLIRPYFLGGCTLGVGRLTSHNWMVIHVIHYQRKKHRHRKIQIWAIHFLVTWLNPPIWKNMH